MNKTNKFRESLGLSPEMIIGVNSRQGWMEYSDYYRMFPEKLKDQIRRLFLEDRIIMELNVEDTSTMIISGKSKDFQIEETVISQSIDDTDVQSIDQSLSSIWLTITNH